MEQMWSDGRAARHSSAKAATAVRIRFRPLKGALQVIVAHFFVSEDKFTTFFTPSSATAESNYLKNFIAPTVQFRNKYIIFALRI